MLDQLRPAALFDLAATSYGEWLGRFEWCWEILARIEEAVRARLRGRVEGTIMPGAHLQGDVDVGPGTVVEPGAFIKGPAIIGARCEVRAGAYVRGCVLIADDCVVGNSSEIKNAVMLEGAHAPHFNYVGDSLLGQRANLGAGVKLSNWKIAAEKGVVLTIEGQRVETGLNKFGAILGDDVEMGCNAVASPGTIIGPRTMIYSNTTVRGFVPADSIVKLRQTLEIIPRRRS